jgi:hypothetical protein
VEVGEQALRQVRLGHGAPCIPIQAVRGGNPNQAALDSPFKRRAQHDFR